MNLKIWNKNTIDFEEFTFMIDTKESFEDVLKINQFSIEGYFPDLTIYYDIDPQSGLNRIASRKNLDRLDVESLNFHNRVHQGYQIVCQMFPDRIKVIDASKSKQEVSEQTYQLIKEKINSYESK